MRIPGAAKAADNLLKWSMNPDWAPYRDQVFEEHLGPACEDFDISEAELAELLGGSFDMVFGCVLEDFFTDRFGEEGEWNIIDDYLKRRGWREKVPGKRYLEALRDSFMSLYEVVDLDPGRSMTVRDLFLGGDPVTIMEKRGSESAARWDRLAARIVTVNNKAYFTGSILLFPLDAADRVLASFEVTAETLTKEIRKEARKQGEPADFQDRDLLEMLLYTSARLFTEAWLIETLERLSAPLPKLINTDGDDILFSEARFPITGDVAAVIAALDGIDAFDRDDPEERHWTWHGQSSPSNRVSQDKGIVLSTADDTGRTVLGNIEFGEDMLVLTTNSKARADKGRDLVLAGLDGLVGEPLTSYQDPEQVLAEQDDAAPEPSDLPPEVAEQAIHAALESHYRRVLDEPVPALGGKSPRQAARTKKGRTEVTNWLKKLENAEARRAAGQGQRPHDVRWMWQELKIDVPR